MSIRFSFVSQRLSVFAYRYEKTTSLTLKNRYSVGFLSLLTLKSAKLQILFVPLQSKRLNNCNYDNNRTQNIHHS